MRPRQKCGKTFVARAVSAVSTVRGCAASPKSKAQLAPSLPAARNHRQTPLSLLLFYLALSCDYSLSVAVDSGIGPEKATSRVHVGQHTHTSLAKIEATLLTTAARDFEGRQEAYAAAVSWHSERLRCAASRGACNSSKSNNQKSAGGEPRGQPVHNGHNQQRQRDSDHSGGESSFPEQRQEMEKPAPYLACARYRQGGSALSRVRDTLRVTASVRTVSHTEEHGTCFLATATPSEADAIAGDMGAFGIDSFGVFPSVLKLSPGLLDHHHGEEGLFAGDNSPAASSEERGRDDKSEGHERAEISEGARWFSKKQYQQQQDQLQSLATTHGHMMRHPNVNGLNVELTPGILPEGVPVDTTNYNHNYDLPLQLEQGLMSKTLDLHASNFWSDENMLDGTAGHLTRAGGALRAREWTRAAQLVHSYSNGYQDGRGEGGESEGEVSSSPGDICGWDSVRFVHAGDDLLLVSG